ncbi:MAG: TetR/AcrR family transcriptional regulator [Candidatus Latescibacteria bacterium]|nr:TetR/AcrR family transcriptional regulator [Candidatus Latescibacterota bacterium]
MSRNHEKMKDTIVEAAREVFALYGYKKTTLDDIAASLHKAKSSIYYYFKSKEDVFRAVIENEVLRAKMAIQNAVTKESTPEMKLRAHFKTIMKFINETINYYKLMQEEMLEVMSFADKMKDKHKKDSIQLIAGILKEGIAAGDFTIVDVNETAEAIMYAFEGLYHPFFGIDYQNTEKKYDKLLDIILYGIKTR